MAELSHPKLPNHFRYHVLRLSSDALVLRYTNHIAQNVLIDQYLSRQIRFVSYLRKIESRMVEYIIVVTRYSHFKNGTPHFARCSLIPWEVLCEPPCQCNS